jgi:hypothetical protein
MSKGLPTVVGLASLLVVAACDHIPYYNESLDWFSWSEYDPEVNAIVAEIPPPGDLEAGPTGMKDGMMAEPPASAPMSGVSGSGSSAALGGTTTVTSIGGGTATSVDGSSTSAPLVGTRNSVGGSVTWRSTRGTP